MRVCFRYDEPFKYTQVQLTMLCNNIEKCFHVAFFFICRVLSGLLKMHAIEFQLINEVFLCFVDGYRHWLMRSFDFSRNFQFSGGGDRIAKRGQFTANAKKPQEAVFPPSIFPLFLKRFAISTKNTNFLFQFTPISHIGRLSKHGRH